MFGQIEMPQKYEMELVKEFHRICQERDLRYVLAFGTMIGAVRHKEFIPSDDDIDVVMPWEDYCKYAEVANTQIS